MIRTASYALAALLFASAAPRAQSRGCVERPVGPTIDAYVIVPLPRGRAAIAVPNLSAAGTDCAAVMPRVSDVLRGAPAPGGLLRGDGRAGDLLR